MQRSDTAPHVHSALNKLLVLMCSLFTCYFIYLLILHNFGGIKKYQPSGTRATQSLPDTVWNTATHGTSHHLEPRTALNAALPVKSKMVTREPQNGQWGLERGPALDYWTLSLTFANKISIWLFLPWESQKSKMAATGPQNGQWGLERCLPLGFWAF